VIYADAGSCVAFADADADPRGHGERQGQGKLKRRAPKLSTPRQADLRKLHAAGEHTIAELAELFEVSRTTVYAPRLDS
jgi:DNA invertase Pin-like site-specific DNA recombinase